MDIEAVRIIGVGPDGRDGLTPELRGIIDCSNELWGSRRLLDLWPDYPGEKVELGGKLTEVLPRLKQRPGSRRVAMLASGDPGFYGLAASVLKILPAEEVCVYPQVGFLQAAFARMRIPWNDAVFTSVHARPVSEVIGLARRYPKIGVLTDALQSPSWVAAKLLAAGVPDCRAVVLENLGDPTETINDTRLLALPGMKFAPLNVLLLIHDENWRPAPVFHPRPDEAYNHRNGLITKGDVRLMSIGRLGIRESDTIWDIGAGSGAMSIEMAEIAWRGRVYAIEKDVQCLEFLKANTERFGTPNLAIIGAEAPRALDDLPAPDGVFIGGSGGALVEILARVQQSARDNCRVVANFTLLNNLVQAHDCMNAHGWQPQLTEAQFSYGSATGAGVRLAPANPVFILSGVVPLGRRE
jgi:precorrin-6Y C5,15-methyltransferase (decarboxylating)